MNYDVKYLEELIELYGYKRFEYGYNKYEDGYLCYLFVYDNIGNVVEGDIGGGKTIGAAKDDAIMKVILALEDDESIDDFINDVYEDIIDDLSTVLVC